ncbi:hypothetical protein [Kitasatospora sp. NPDC001683]
MAGVQAKGVAVLHNAGAELLGHLRAMMPATAPSAEFPLLGRDDIAAGVPVGELSGVNPSISRPGRTSGIPPPARRYNLVGSGPYLVDGHDGSIHPVPATTWIAEDWEELYLRQIKGARTPDPLVSTVRALVGSAGAVAAMSHLLKQVPRLSLQEARAYVRAIQDGAEPSDELANLTREAQSCPPLPITTLAGPIQ